MLALKREQQSEIHFLEFMRQQSVNFQDNITLVNVLIHYTTTTRQHKIYKYVYNVYISVLYNKFYKHQFYSNKIEKRLLRLKTTSKPSQ